MGKTHKDKIIKKKVTNSKVYYQLKTDNGVKWCQYEQLTDYIPQIIQYQKHQKAKQVYGGKAQTHYPTNKTINVQKKLTKNCEVVTPAKLEQTNAPEEYYIKTQVHQKKVKKQNTEVPIYNQHPVKQEQPVQHSTSLPSFQVPKIEPSKSQQAQVKIEQDLPQKIKEEHLPKPQSHNLSIRVQDGMVHIPENNEQQSKLQELKKKRKIINFVFYQKKSDKLMFKVWYNDGSFSVMSNQQLRVEVPDMLLDFLLKNVEICFE